MKDIFVTGRFGTYPHAFIKIKNTFGLKATYQINSTRRYYSASDGAPVAEALQS